MKHLLLLLVAAMLALACSLVQANSLRDRISEKMMVKSALYDAVEHDLSDPDPLDVFNNGSQSNITTPVEVWNTVPDWLRYTFGCIVAIVGLIITFFGVRFLALSVFLLGGFIAAAITFAILAAAVSNSEPQKTAIVYGTSFSVWLVAGIILACCIKLAVFILGASLGAVVALVLNPIALKYVWPEQPYANLIIWIVIFALIGGAIACCLTKPLLILATSAGGAFAVVASIMAMVGTLNIAATAESGLSADTTWQDWAGFGGFIGLAILGVIIQFCCTARPGDMDGYTKMKD